MTLSERLTRGEMRGLRTPRDLAGSHRWEPGALWNKYLIAQSC